MLGVGSYTIPEAARLVGQHPSWVRRLVRGYAFTTPAGRRSSSPQLFAPAYVEGGHPAELTFNDLIELKFASDFLAAGVSLQVIRRAAAKAAQLFGGDHPFLRYRFQTDGHRIFAEAALQSGEEKMIDLLSGQHVFASVINRYLMQLEYGREGIVTRWFPLGKRQDVLLDPCFSFGRPVVRDAHVPTSVLAAAVKAGDALGKVARWFEVPVKSVRAAVAFEQQLAAA